MKQVAFLGDVGRNIGGIGHCIFVADDRAKFRDQIGGKRRHGTFPGALDDIHFLILFHSRPFILARLLRGAAGR